jgi:hypothetical protein
VSEKSRFPIEKPDSGLLHLLQMFYFRRAGIFGENDARFTLEWVPTFELDAPSPLITCTLHDIVSHDVA